MATYQNEPDFKYICRICDTEHRVKGFPSHLFAKHNIRFIDYVKLHLDDFAPIWKLCPICNENITNKMTCSKACGYILRDITHPPRNIWAEMNDVTKANAKKKIGELATIRQAGISPWNNMSVDVRISAKKKIADKTSLRVKGSGNPMYGKTHSPQTIQKIFQYRKINKLEQKIADMLDSYDVKYKFQFYLSDSSTYSYDFRINDINLLIEIDGDYWHGNPNTTNHCRNVDEVRKNDSVKNEVAKKYGYDLVRYWEYDIKTNFDMVVKSILTEINNRFDQLVDKK